MIVGVRATVVVMMMMIVAGAHAPDLAETISERQTSVRRT
jgi:hypothetical protein